jgi:hypothetical protein
MLSGDERRRLNEIASQLWAEDRKWAEGIGTGRPHRPKGATSLRRPRPWVVTLAVLCLATGYLLALRSWWTFAPAGASLLAAAWLFVACLPGRFYHRIRRNRPPRRSRRHTTL